MTQGAIIHAARGGSRLQDFEAAVSRVRGVALHTPLLPFVETARRSVRVKAENLQPVGSFKIRCGVNALAVLSDEDLSAGAVTVSAGNFAQGLGYAAGLRGVRLKAYVPDTAPAVKLDALRRLGVEVVSRTPDQWMAIATTRQTGEDDGVFIHPVSDAAILHGNGTIALELVRDWPEIDTVVVPMGGGGLLAGVALAFRALGRSVRIVACEVEGAAPLAAALRCGRPVVIERHASFVDAIGSTQVLPQMWDLLSELVDEVIVVPVEDARRALATLAVRHHLVVEGAGAVAAAASLSGACGGEKVAAILTGGNIDMGRFSEILGDHAAAVYL